MGNTIADMVRRFALVIFLLGLAVLASTEASAAHPEIELLHEPDKGLAQRNEQELWAQKAAEKSVAPKQALFHESDAVVPETVDDQSILTEVSMDETTGEGL